MHKILFFNDKLYKWKIVNTTLCDFCNEALDSLEHRFLYCRVTQEFWRNLNLWLDNKFNIECTLNSLQKIVTNICHVLPIIDTVMLNAKYYIYTCFIKQTIPKISIFNRIIDDLEKTEEHIAVQRGLLYSHKQKWNV